MTFKSPFNRSNAISTKISPNFDIAIPKDIQSALNLQPGDSLEFHIQEDGSIVLHKEVIQDASSQQAQAPLFVWEWEDGEEEEEALGRVS